MDNKLMKNVIRLVSSFVATIVIFAGAVTAQADGSNPVDKYPLSLDMDIAMDPGHGHTLPGGRDRLRPDIDNMWKNLPITVEDENGNKVEVKKELDFGNRRVVGNFAVGQKLTITVDTTGILDGYHLSYESKYKYPANASSYAKFTVEYKFNNGKGMLVRIPFAQMKVKFDLQGGNINGNSDSFEKLVDQNNTVDFPQDPTKENVEFGGWFTELPDIDAYRQRGIVGKRYYWNNKSLFSDYNRDWQQWNDVKIDPLYNGIFLLRAQWNARAIFDAKGGVFADQSEKKNEVTIAGKEIKIAQAPTRDGYQFLNWVDAEGNKYNPNDAYTLAQNKVFTAQWKETTSTVTFMNDKNNYAKVKVEKGKSIAGDSLKDQSMPADPVKDGFTFKEWNTKEDGTGTKFDGATVVDADLTVYAIYTKNAGQNPSVPNPDPNQPGANPNQPGGQPGVNPNQPGGQPGGQPGDQPGMNPNQPGVNPTPNPGSDNAGNNAGSGPAGVPGVTPGGQDAGQSKKSGQMRSLPNTGDSSSLVALFAGVGFLMAGCGFLRKKKLMEKNA